MSNMVDNANIGGSKPRIAVIGMGRYFRKIYPGILKYFEPTDLVDLIEKADARSSLLDILSPGKQDAIMLLSPNEVHASQIAEVSHLKCPTLVEKPVATTKNGLSLVSESLQVNPRLYCSDFYPDVMALSLFNWFGRITPLDMKPLRIEGEVSLWLEGMQAIGQITSVDAVLLEGEGEARGFEGREWLWHPIHGGVLWDLAYHYLTLWYYLFGEPLFLSNVKLGFGESAPISPSAEISADLALVSQTGVPVSIRVCKYHIGRNTRWFEIRGEKGLAKMFFSSPNFLTITSQGKRCDVYDDGDYYSHVAEGFRHFVGDPSSVSHGVEAVRVAMDIILQAKQEGRLSS